MERQPKTRSNFINRPEEADMQIGYPGHFVFLMGQWVKDDQKVVDQMLVQKLRLIYQKIAPNLPQLGTPSAAANNNSCTTPAVSVHPHYSFDSFVNGLNPDDKLVQKLFEFLIRVLFPLNFFL
jgi:hypothetical protein